MSQVEALTLFNTLQCFSAALIPFGLGTSVDTYIHFGDLEQQELVHAVHR